MNKANIVKTIERSLRKLNLIGLIDHGGRAGSNFFCCLFDSHEEVISVPWIHYSYSYFMDKFRTEHRVNKNDAKLFLCNETYFKYLYNYPKKHSHELIKKIGGNIFSFKKRKELREIFDIYIDHKEEFSRRDLILLPYICFALSIKKKIDLVKYVLINDAANLRNENIIDNFDGKIVDIIIKDFPKAKMISLARDPRAQYASSRHQSVNEFDNNYNLSFKNFFRIFYNLLKEKVDLDSGPANLSWILYQIESTRIIHKCKKRYKTNFITIRNEDINLNFIKTMTKLSKWLNISFFKNWLNKKYEPTMLGAKWKGTGAYSNSYQKVTDGLLANDPNEISKTLTRPNKFVTERWKNRMNKNEILFLERIFFEEIKSMEYKFSKDLSKISDLRIFFRYGLVPDIGEKPTYKWIKNGFKKNTNIFFNRILYFIFFPLLFIICRIKLFKFLVIKKKFKKVIY